MTMPFNESSFRLDSDPVQAKAILRKHPLIKPGLLGTGADKSVGFRLLNRAF